MAKELKLSEAVEKLGNIYPGDPGYCPVIPCDFPIPSPCKPSPPHASVCHWEEVEPKEGDFVVGCRDGKLVLFPVVDCNDDEEENGE